MRTGNDRSSEAKGNALSKAVEKLVLMRPTSCDSSGSHLCCKRNRLTTMFINSKPNSKLLTLIRCILARQSVSLPSLVFSFLRIRSIYGHKLATGNCPIKCDSPYLRISPFIIVDNTGVSLIDHLCTCFLLIENIFQLFQ